jgi:hypothetical protein
MLSMLLHLLVGLTLVCELDIPATSLAASFTGKVVGVIDADTSTLCITVSPKESG